MKKQLLLWISLLLLTTGCAPKIGKIHAMNESKSLNTGEVSIIRNYNYAGSAVRLYPTVNNKKIAGLYTKDYVHFFLKEGTYKFGLMFPDVISGKWIKANFIDKQIKSNSQYYFLLSPTLFSMEIEEIEKEDAIKRISSSTLVKTGVLSNEAGVIVNAIKPIGDLMGLKENDETVE